MKQLEYYIPGVNLTDATPERLRAFAVKHNDQYAVTVADDPQHPDHVKGLQMSFIRVIHAEKGIRFHMLETEDGNYAVYMPDAWNPMPYEQLFDAVYPYLCEIMPTYQRNLEPIMVNLSY